MQVVAATLASVEPVIMKAMAVTADSAAPGLSSAETVDSGVQADAVSEMVDVGVNADAESDAAARPSKASSTDGSKVRRLEQLVPRPQNIRGSVGCQTMKALGGEIAG